MASDSKEFFRHEMAVPFIVAPSLRDALNISPRAGTYTAPARGPCSSTAPIETAHIGMSKKKLEVPSMGSMCHVMPEVPDCDAPSSPTIASFARICASPAVMSSSLALSYCVTMSVGEDLVVAVTSPLLRPRRAMSPAWRARVSAMERSSLPREVDIIFCRPSLATHRERVMQVQRQLPCLLR